jgi:hypothetical protein
MYNGGLIGLLRLFYVELETMRLPLSNRLKNTRRRLPFNKHSWKRLIVLEKEETLQKWPS